MEARSHRGGVGHGDGHRDQQHHPGLAGPQLGRAAGQERPPAIEEHGRPEHRADQADPGEVEVVAEPVHDHLTGDRQRDGEHEAHPEQAMEHLRVVPGMAAMAAMAVMFGVTGVVHGPEGSVPRP